MIRKPKLLLPIILVITLPVGIFPGCGHRTFDIYQYQVTVKSYLDNMVAANEQFAWESTDKLASILDPVDEQWDTRLQELFKSGNTGVLWRLHYLVDKCGIERFRDEFRQLLPRLRFPLNQYNLQLLGKMRDKKTRELLLEILREQREPLIPIAIRVLGQVGKTSDINEILKYANSSNPLIRESVLDSLYQGWGQVALEPILEFLDDTDVIIVCKTINYISQWHDNKIRDQLIHYISSSISNENSTGIPSVSLFPESRIVKRTTSPKTHFDVSPRALSILALKHYNDSKTINFLVNTFKDPDPMVREYVAISLGSIGNQTVAASLLVLLGDDSSRVRKATAWSLGRLQQEIAVAPLLTSEKMDPDRDVREQARIALREIQKKD